MRVGNQLKILKLLAGIHSTASTKKRRHCSSSPANLSIPPRARRAVRLPARPTWPRIHIRLYPDALYDPKIEQLDRVCTRCTRHRTISWTRCVHSCGTGTSATHGLVGTDSSQAFCLGGWTGHRNHAGKRLGKRPKSGRPGIRNRTGCCNSSRTHDLAVDRTGPMSCLPTVVRHRDRRLR